MSPAVQGVSLKNRKISPGQSDMIWRKQELVELAPQYQENKKFNGGGGISLDLNYTLRVNKTLRICIWQKAYRIRVKYQSEATR